MRRIILALACAVVMGTPAPTTVQAQSLRERDTKVRLVLKDNLSSQGISAVIRRGPGAPAGDMIAFQRSDFTPELLGYTLKAFDATAPTATHRKLNMRISREMPLPRLQGAWSQTVRALAAQLQSAPYEELEGVGRARVLLVTVPEAPLCPECARRASAPPKKLIQ